MQIPTDYPLVIAAALGMSWQMWGFGLSLGRFRQETFNEDFMRKEFGTVHQKELGEDIERGGYPDTGNGLYAQRLSYRYVTLTQRLVPIQRAATHPPQLC